MTRLLLGGFSLSIVGDNRCTKGMVEKGASVSVLPKTIYKKLNMGELKFTTITLQMVDHSIIYPLGVLEDVPVRVGKFYIPVDFVVVDIVEDTQIPIILGRSFIHTAGEVIDVKKGKLTLTIGDDKVTFSLSHVMKRFTGDGDPGDAVDASPTVGARGSVLDGTGFGAPGR
ncbi:uncharacterized protein [Spinacia oleracea]|uniref:Aspartic peptidase DDI1-type domain-containing protein n=1 Tax=Spinacia oleracea TaxID=3562 RepID=A0ABM3RIZ4_SPIOL|nr:uncharacterized protein LOC130470045 [Spinacia oleracea]